jgi:hypothetical protein
MKFRVLLLVTMLVSAAFAGACQMSVLPRACLQEEGCEHHPINR